MPISQRIYTQPPPTTSHPDLHANATATGTNPVDYSLRMLDSESVHESLDKLPRHELAFQLRLLFETVRREPQRTTDVVPTDMQTRSTWGRYHTLLAQAKVQLRGVSRQGPEEREASAQAAALLAAYYQAAEDSGIDAAYLMVMMRMYSEPQASSDDADLITRYWGSREPQDRCVLAGAVERLIRCALDVGPVDEEEEQEETPRGRAVERVTSAVRVRSRSRGRRELREPGEPVPRRAGAVDAVRRLCCWCFEWGGWVRMGVEGERPGVNGRWCWSAGMFITTSFEAER